MKQDNVPYEKYETEVIDKNNPHDRGYHFGCACVTEAYKDLMDMAGIALRELVRKQCDEVIIKGLEKELAISNEIRVGKR